LPDRCRRRSHRKPASGSEHGETTGFAAASAGYDAARRLAA